MSSAARPPRLRLIAGLVAMILVAAAATPFLGTASAGKGKAGFSGKLCGLISGPLLTGTGITAPFVQTKTLHRAPTTIYYARWGANADQPHYLLLSVTKVSGSSKPGALFQKRFVKRIKSRGTPVGVGSLSSVVTETLEGENPEEVLVEGTLLFVAHGYDVLVYVNDKEPGASAEEVEGRMTLIGLSIAGRL